MKEPIKRDFTKGILCSSCDNHNNFCGGQMSRSGDILNYNCDCGFSACLVVPNDKYCFNLKWIEK